MGEPAVGGQGIAVHAAGFQVLLDVLLGEEQAAPAHAHPPGAVFPEPCYIIEGALRDAQHGCGRLDAEEFLVPLHLLMAENEDVARGRH